MIRRTFGCCLALVLAAGLLVAAIVAAPFISAQTPKAISAVQHGIAVLESDIKGKSTPSIVRPWPSGPPAQPTPWAKAEPTAPPVYVSGTSWLQPSSADCQWGGATLADDAQLDLQSATTYPSLSAWYHETAGWWETAQNDLLGLCGQGPAPTAAECLADLANFETAKAEHENAASGTVVPDNTPFDHQWNAIWTDHYTRLEGIWTSTGCGQQVGN